MVHPLACKVFAEKLADSLMEIPLQLTLCFPLVALRSLSLTFVILIMMCLFMSLFEFILSGTLWASCSWISVSFFRFGNFSDLISSTPFPFWPPSVSLLPVEEVNLLCIGLRVLSHRSCMLLSFLFPFVSLSRFCFFFFCSGGWFTLLYLPDCIFILLCHLVSYSFLFEGFLISEMVLCILDGFSSIFLASSSLLQRSSFISVCLLGFDMIFSWIFPKGTLVRSSWLEA